MATEEPVDLHFITQTPMNVRLEMMTSSKTNQLGLHGSVGSLMLHMQKVPGSHPGLNGDDTEDHSVQARKEHRL